MIDLVRTILGTPSIANDTVAENLTLALSMIEALGFCLSAERDQLSQWRGYADDARGVAIGFDSDRLRALALAHSDDNLAFQVMPVDYQSDALRKSLSEPIEAVKSFVEGANYYSNKRKISLWPSPSEEKDHRNRLANTAHELFLLLLPVASAAYAVKSPFFSEEREWRIYCLTTKDEASLELANAEFRHNGSMFIPFINFPTDQFSPDLIQEVVLGPKHQTPIHVVRAFLRRNGFAHVKVEQSVGSYR